MTNAERIAADIGFIIGQYERREITAQDVVLKMNEITGAWLGCQACVYRGCQCMSDDGTVIYRCSDGIKAWLTKEA